MENKRDRFVRIVEARTNKILDMLRLLANCANKSNYEYDEEDIKQIFSAIDKEVKATKTKYYKHFNSNSYEKVFYNRIAFCVDSFGLLGGDYKWRAEG